MEMVMVRQVRESSIERAFCRAVHQVGGIPEKFKASRRGVPDRLVLLPGGGMALCEIKRPGEAPRADQEAVHDEYRALGHQVFVIDSIAAVDAFIAAIGATDMTEE